MIVVDCSRPREASGKLQSEDSGVHSRRVTGKPEAIGSSVGLIPINALVSINGVIPGSKSIPAIGSFCKLRLLGGPEPGLG